MHDSIVHGMATLGVSSDGPGRYGAAGDVRVSSLRTIDVNNYPRTQRRRVSPKVEVYSKTSLTTPGKLQSEAAVATSASVPRLELATVIKSG